MKAVKFAKTITLAAFCLGAFTLFQHFVIPSPSNNAVFNLGCPDKVTCARGRGGGIFLTWNGVISQPIPADLPESFSVQLSGADFVYGLNPPFTVEYFSSQNTFRISGFLGPVDCSPFFPSFSGTVTMQINGVANSCGYQNGILVQDPFPPVDPPPDPVIVTCTDLVQVCGGDIQQIASDILGPVTAPCNQWGGPCLASDDIYRAGKVGIGTDSIPYGFQLAVKGDIVTEQFKVCSDGGWCDYVFEDDYSLLSLQEVEDFVEQNGHLPNSPSTEEIKQNNGYDLGLMTLNQQEKIEEIFLHLIDLKKETDFLEKEVESISEEE